MAIARHAADTSVERATVTGAIDTEVLSPKPTDMALDALSRKFPDAPAENVVSERILNPATIQLLPTVVDWVIDGAFEFPAMADAANPPTAPEYSPTSELYVVELVPPVYVTVTLVIGAEF